MDDTHGHFDTPHEGFQVYQPDVEDIDYDQADMPLATMENDFENNDQFKNYNDLYLQDRKVSVREDPNAIKTSVSKIVMEKEDTSMDALMKRFK